MDEEEQNDVTGEDTQSTSTFEHIFEHILLPADVNDFSTVLQSLINSGVLHIMVSEERVQYVGNIPKIQYLPNTDGIDKSEFAIITKQLAGLNAPKRKILEEQNLLKILHKREIGAASPYKNFSYSKKCNVSNRFLPTAGVDIDTYDGKVFCGLFSKDGNLFITASQDRLIRIYKSDDGSYKLMKIIRATDIGWSIIDVAFSPDQQDFVYSTWSPSLYLCSVNDSTKCQEPLSIVNNGTRFCIFSVIFSSDGKELLGGANDGCLYIYDRHLNKTTSTIEAHSYDVNSVAFADETSHIIYSGGDDGLIKVWDRRDLKESIPKPVGVLAGHIDGITFVDSKQDGRHLISNSKDQSIKLWDIRRFSGNKAADKSLNATSKQNWDYRWQDVPKKLYTNYKRMEGDTSVMTYRGHVVIKTLVRCRFSPVETTGQRYIYTGCGLGQVIVYDVLTGKIIETYKGHQACVRDVSWHPNRMEIMSASWDGLVKKWSYLYNKEDAQELCEDYKFDKYSGDLQKIRKSLRLATRSRRNQSGT